MTAFYMFRLMAMTFFGAYRGPAWERAAGDAGRSAAVRGVAHRPMRTPTATRTAGSRSRARPGRRTSDGARPGHGHGPWHGPHESPTPMTFPLMALAVGAIVAGFVGIPAALGGGNTIEHFLEPSFTAQAVHGAAAPARRRPRRSCRRRRRRRQRAASPRCRAASSSGLMAFSVLVAVVGIGLAWKFYVTSPEISERLAQQLAGRAPRCCRTSTTWTSCTTRRSSSGTMASGRGLWTFDRNVVDGAVNGAGLADGDQLVVLGPDRPDGRRRRW